MNSHTTKSLLELAYSFGITPLLYFFKNKPVGITNISLFSKANDSEWFSDDALLCDYTTNHKNMPLYAFKMQNWAIVGVK